MTGTIRPLRLSGPNVLCSSLVLLGACRDTFFIEDDGIEPGGILIYASVDSDGELSRVGVRRAEDDGKAFRFDVRGTEAFATWTLPPGSLVDESGAPLDIELQARSKDEATGCGRCLAPTPRAPQVLFEGDSCRPPSFAKSALFRPDSGASFVGDESPAGKVLLEELRNRVRFGREGACPCTMEPGPPLGRLRIKPISPEPDPDQLYTFAQNGNGLFAGFGPGVAWSHSSTTGVSQLTRFDDPMAGNDDWLAVGLGSGAFVTFHRRLGSTEGRDGQFRLFEPDLDGRLGPPTDISQRLPELRFEDMRSLPSEPSRFYVMGALDTGLALKPAIVACSVDPLACAAETLGSCVGVRGAARVRTVHELADGTAVALTENALFYRGPGQTAWACNAAPGPFPVRGTAEFLAVGELRNLSSIGERLFVCGEILDQGCGGTPWVVLTGLANPSGPVDFEVLQRHESPCVSIHRAWDRPGHVRSVHFDRTYQEFDRDGNLVTAGPLGLAYPSTPSGAFEMQPSWLLVLAGGNRIFVARDDDPFVQIRGSTTEAGIGRYREALSVDEDELLFLTEGGVLTRVRVLDEIDEDGFPRTAIAGVQDLTGRLQAIVASAAAIDTLASSPEEGTTVLLVVGKLELEPFIGWVTVEGDRVTELREVELGEGLSAPIVAVAEADPGRMIAVSSSGEFLIVTEQGAERAVVDFDDPTTPEVEEIPAPSGCPGAFAQRFRAFFRAEGKSGVVWFIGNDGGLIRYAGGDFVRFARPRDVEYRALKVFCPSDIALAGTEVTTDVVGKKTSRLAFARVTGDADTTSILRFSEPDERTLDLIDPKDSNYDEPIAIVRDLDNFAVIFDGGAIAAIRTDLTPIPVPSLISAAGIIRPGQIVLGARESQLLLAVPE